jgi:hypothetical protein
MLINEQEKPEPPFSSGTIILIEKVDGRFIRLSSREEAEELSRLAKFVAENWG